MTGSNSTVQVTSRAPSARSAGSVVVTPPEGPAFALSAEEARELQARILSAAVQVERGQRATVAKAKTSTAAREIRRSAEVDETLRDRDGGR